IPSINVTDFIICSRKITYGWAAGGSANDRCDGYSVSVHSLDVFPSSFRKKMAGGLVSVSSEGARERSLSAVTDRASKGPASEASAKHASAARGHSVRIRRAKR